MRRSGWQDHTCDPSIINDLLKCSTEHGVAVMDEVLAVGQKSPLLHGHVAGHLDHPCPVGMWGDPSHMHLPAAQMDEKQDVIRHESAQRPDLRGEKVGRHEDIHVRTDEL